jgi:hypothetical protein
MLLLWGLRRANARQWSRKVLVDAASRRTARPTDSGALVETFSPSQDFLRSMSGSFCDVGRSRGIRDGRMSVPNQGDRMQTIQNNVIAGQTMEFVAGTMLNIAAKARARARDARSRR